MWGRYTAERSDYGRSGSSFQTVKSVLTRRLSQHLAEQGGLLATSALLSFDRGDRGHVENAACGH